jgi:hypothetical protein
MVVGRADAEVTAFVVDDGRAATMRHQATALPARCLSCVNVYHCVRGCPEVCRVGERIDDEQETFRCRVQRLLTEAWIWRACAASAVSTKTPAGMKVTP